MIHSLQPYDRERDGDDSDEDAGAEEERANRDARAARETTRRPGLRSRATIRGRVRARVWVVGVRVTRRRQTWRLQHRFGVGVGVFVAPPSRTNLIAARTWLRARPSRRGCDGRAALATERLCPCDSRAAYPTIARRAIRSRPRTRPRTRRARSGGRGGHAARRSLEATATRGIGGGVGGRHRRISRAGLPRCGVIIIGVHWRLPATVPADSMHIERVSAASLAPAH